jgi:hypothetical protein
MIIVQKILLFIFYFIFSIVAAIYLDLDIIQTIHAVIGSILTVVVLNKKNEYVHQNNFQINGYLIISFIIILVSINLPMLFLITISSLLTIYIFYSYTFNINYKLTVLGMFLNIIILGVLLLLINFEGSKTSTFYSVISGVQKHNIYLLCIPIIITLFYILGKLILMKKIFFQMFDVPIAILLSIYILITTGLIIPFIPISRVVNNKAQKALFIITLFLPLISIGLKSINTIFYIISPLFSIIGTVTILFLGKTYYDKSRFSLLEI